MLPFPAQTSSYFSFAEGTTKELGVSFLFQYLSLNCFGGFYCLTRLSQCYYLFNDKIPIGVKMFCMWSFNFTLYVLSSISSWLTSCFNAFWSSRCHVPGLASFAFPTLFNSFISLWSTLSQRKPNNRHRLCWYSCHLILSHQKVECLA